MFTDMTTKDDSAILKNHLFDIIVINTEFVRF